MHAYKPKQWTQTTVGLSVALGPVLGGVLIALGGQDLGWRLTFLVNVPIGLLVLILGFIWLPRPLLYKVKSDDKRHRGIRALDPLGSLLLGLVVFTILYPFVQTQAPNWVWFSIPISVLLLFLWLKWEVHYSRVGGSPMVNLKLFSTSSFTNGTLVVSLNFLGMSSIWVLVAIYFQEGNGNSALEAGLVGLPSALMSAFSAMWAGRNVSLFGRKIVIFGLIMTIIGLLSSITIVLLHEFNYASPWWLLLSLGIVGVGQGSVTSPNQTLTLADVPLNYAGSSGAIMQTGQRIGTSIGIAFITALVFAIQPISTWGLAIISGFTLTTVIVLIALGIAFKDLRDRKKLSKVNI